MPAAKPISAYDLCSRVLTASEGDASALIKLAGGQETDWLEFKATCEPPSSGIEIGSNADDFRWHVAKAVVALANTHGGCLLLGVDDEGKAVGLAPSDPSGKIEKEGMDLFLQHLDQAVFRRVAGWKCSKKGLITFDDSLPENLIDYRLASLGGVPVIAVLVKPAAAGESCLYCCEMLQGKKLIFVLIRKAGHLGQTQKITHPKEIFSWQKERKPTSHHFSELWKRFEEPGSGRRRRLLAGSASLALLLVGLGAYHFSQPHVFATIQVRKLEMSFTGEKENLTPAALEGVASVLYKITPASAGKSLWGDWTQQAKGVMVGVLDVAGSSIVAKVVGSGAPTIAAPEGIHWYSKAVSWAASLWPSPTAGSKSQAKEQLQFIPAQLSLTINAVEIRASGDFDSIEGMSKIDLQEEFAKRLAEHGIRMPAP